MGCSQSTKLIITPRSDSTAIDYHSARLALSTARFHHKGQLATADTWFYQLSKRITGTTRLSK